MSDDIFGDIDNFLANGGEPAEPKPERPEMPSPYCHDTEPPNDGYEWLRCETTEGRVFWVATGQRL